MMTMEMEIEIEGEVKNEKIENPALNVSDDGANVENEPENLNIIAEPEVDNKLENPDVNRLKEVQRRRSLRNEQAVKKKPPKYEEIYNCYKRKEYKECVIYLDLVSETTKDCIEYQILKATCLINIGGSSKLPEAHRILDDVIKQKPENAYCSYAKGLAFYQENRWKEAIECFTKAIALDQPSMNRAEILLKLAQENLEKNPEEEKEEQEEESENEEIEIDNNEDQEASQDSNDSMSRRFGCELCNKYFAKKFNLDRHNKTFHDRETPPIPPLPRNRNSLEPVKNKKEKVEEVEIKEEELDDSVISEEAPSPPKTKKRKSFKIKLSGRSSFGSSDKEYSSKKSPTVLKNGLARCNICKKIYTKGSLARHQIIHTGNKQFKCEDCGKAFYQKSDLERHVVSLINIFY